MAVATIVVEARIAVLTAWPATAVAGCAAALVLLGGFTGTAARVVRVRSRSVLELVAFMAVAPAALFVSGTSWRRCCSSPGRKDEPMDGLMWAAIGTALVVSLAALGLGLVLAARYRQLHERAMSADAFAGAPFPSLGAPAPRFDAVARDGIRADGAELSQGRAVVVAFDTSCPACLELLPEIGAFLAGRSEETNALALISGAEAALAPYLSGLPASVRVVGPATDELIAAFGVRAFPTILLYQDGRLIAAGSRPVDVAVPTGQ